MNNWKVEPSRRRPVSNNKKTLRPNLTYVLLALSLFAAVFFFILYQGEKKDGSSLSEQNKQDISSQVLTDLKKIFYIKTTDQPTVAAIDDIEKLRETNPQFYDGVNNGDYLILYPQRAIVYRHSENIVVNVAPIVGGAAGEDVSPSEQ